MHASVINLKDSKLVWETLKAHLNTASNDIICLYLDECQNIKIKPKVSCHIYRLIIVENKTFGVFKSLDQVKRRSDLLKDFILIQEKAQN